MKAYKLDFDYFVFFEKYPQRVVATQRKFWQLFSKVRCVLTRKMIEEFGGEYHG